MDTWTFAATIRTLATIKTRQRAQRVGDVLDLLLRASAPRSSLSATLCSPWTPWAALLIIFLSRRSSGSPMHRHFSTSVAFLRFPANHITTTPLRLLKPRLVPSDFVWTAHAIELNRVRRSARVASEVNLPQRLRPPLASMLFRNRPEARQVAGCRWQRAAAIAGDQQKVLASATITEQDLVA